MVSWEIEGDQFKVVPKVTEDSIQVDQTLKTWTANLSEEDLRDFFDLFFGLFYRSWYPPLWRYDCRYCWKNPKN